MTPTQTINADLFVRGKSVSVSGTPRQVLLKSMSCITLWKIRISDSRGMWAESEDGINFSGTMPKEELAKNSSAFFRLWMRSQMNWGKT